MLYVSSASGPENYWGLWAQTQKYRHASEGGVWKTPQDFELRRWHEFAERELLCEMSHALIYGRNQTRSGIISLPIDQFFKRYPQARSVSLVYYKIDRSLEPVTPAPYATGSASREVVKEALAKRMPRVAWKKVDTVEPTFRMIMSRNLWQSLRTQIPTQKNLPRSTYDSLWCQKMKGVLPPVELVKVATEK